MPSYILSIDVLPIFVFERINNLPEKGEKAKVQQFCVYNITNRQGCHDHSKTSFEKNCFSAWASTLNMGLINEVDMVCLSPVGYGV